MLLVMPITDAARAALAASQAIDPTLVQPRKDRVAYRAFMQRDDVPVRTSPTAEVEWMAFNLSIRDVDYAKAPSKVAATWLRRLRLKKSLKDKFWSDTWTYYIENRLSLELRAAAPPARKRGTAVQSEDSSWPAQAYIDQFKKKGESAGGNGASP